MIELICQETWVMCTHIWRFSKNYGKINRYVYKTTKQRSGRTFKMGNTHHSKR